MMRWIRVLFVRLSALFRRNDGDADVRAEMEAHLEMEIAANLERGMEPAEARRQALLSSGGLLQAVDAVRDQRRLPWLESIVADGTYAIRALRRSRGFAAVVVLTLALGIGANTAIFSVVRGVLLKPLPHRDGDRLVYLRQSTDGPAGDDIGFSVPEVRDLRNSVASLAGIAEYSAWNLVLQNAEGAERIQVGLVTGNYFEVMGLSAVIGRVTTEADDGAGAEPVIVLTYDAWRDRFGLDSTIVGRQLILDNRAVTVIGVLQPAPFHPRPIEGLLNMAISEHHLSAQMVEGRTHRMTDVIARVRSGRTLEQVRGETDATYERMRRDHAEAYDAAANPRISVIPFRDVLGERARLTLLLLMGAAGFILIISVANVSNLTLMRGVRRQHELVVRAALGAGAGRLRRLLLAENLLLVFLGATVGAVIAVTGLRLLVRLAERYSSRAAEITLDASVFGFTIALSLLVALLLSFIGTLPREGRYAAAVLSGAQRSGGAVTRHRLQRALVVVQVAVSVMLLAGAGLLTRTMLRLASVDTGLQSEQVLTMQIALLTPQQLLSDPAAEAAAQQKYEQMRAEVAALPGVLDAALGSPGPLQSSSVRFDVKAEGRTPPPGAPVPSADYRTADPGFFRTSGIPMLRGRAFADTDRRGAARVVVINQTLADQLFPGEDPVGRRIAWTGDVLRFTPISADWRTVVGVVANTRDGGLDAPPRGVVFSPFAQALALGGSLVVRADADVASIVPAATRIVRRLAPSAPIERVQTIAQMRAESIAPRRLNAALISSFGILAVIIAAVGIAGVLAFSVSARTREIGIRMGLGADRGRVQRMILREGGTLIVAGLITGVLGAIIGARAIRGLLYGIEPYDPTTLTLVALAMLTIGLIASWIPAARAARIDPAITMRTS